MSQDLLDTPLMGLAIRDEVIPWTVRHAVEGVQIFGGIGSGKTSGSGRTLALKYLNAGFGGLVLTVKPDEKNLWEEYCKETGRSDDLLIVEPGHKNVFNFLEYESSQADGNSITGNVVDVLKTVMKADEEKGGGGGDDAFWDNALDMLIFHIIDLCKLAYGNITLRQMYDIVQSLPKQEEGYAGRLATPKNKDLNAFSKAFETAQIKVNKLTDEWEDAQTVERLQELNANNSYDEAVQTEIEDVRMLKLVDQFFMENLMTLHEKTRSIIDFSFSGFLFRFLRDPVYSLFGSQASTFTPEDSLKGKIILINLPVKVYQKIGRDCQIMFKYIWQRAMEKRSINADSLPVFLWADEAQNFLHEHDTHYQATARSSRIATVYISQNLPNYMANMGGAKSDFKVKSFLGTLGTKIFHANADIDTNKYASELIGDGNWNTRSTSNTVSGQFSSSQTDSIRIDRLIRPEWFAGLKTGGSGNNFIVEGYMHLQGNTLKENSNYIKINFNQKFTIKTSTP
ncbi:MAG: TraM recognition domain-containing protein [Bacteroidetes bacterium]|nr:TraM recognition domain-containing protein [Bacteroidota bacterium]